MNKYTKQIESQNPEGGRPTKDFDEKLFKDLCKLHCTLKEFEGIFEADGDTINKWCKRKFGLGFSDSFKRFSASGKISLRRAQYLQAIDKGNVTMQIWLGKQLLGQKEIVQHEGNTHNPIALSYATMDKFSELKQLQEKLEKENIENG